MCAGNPQRVGGQDRPATEAPEPEGKTKRLLGWLKRSRAYKLAESVPWKKARAVALFLVVLGAFYLLYRETPLHPTSIDGKRSWIEQIIDTRLIIALFQASVFCGLIFLITSIVGALLDNRLLESFGGTSLAKVRGEGINAVSELAESSLADFAEANGAFEAMRKKHKRQVRKLRKSPDKDSEIIGQLRSLIAEKDAIHEADKQEIAKLRKRLGKG